MITFYVLVQQGLVKNGSHVRERKSVYLTLKLAKLLKLLSFFA